MDDENKLKCRICPHCNGIMIQTMCLAGSELVCVPCQYGVGMLNGLDEKYITEKEHSELYDKYSKDINKMAFEKGRATCKDCGEYGGNNCATCNIDYDYKYKREE